ncbi:cobalt transporter [Paenibacillus sp. LC231]|uniref:energy-coupling factor transporter transmembrane component T family protein n=1 Tax=unclassified Paenibacillus TaxID=185978 RepID=UPI0008DD0C69|nr:MULTISPECIES: energy-coupling factor transporter transmembrane component T [unclassified Paenibacillus]MCT1402193.1 energy-coupling factor transporter transmembrane protein EcfT [Paenibacillus sp. p3-SID867]OIB00479.1 cobalt transporter [Paenibacillus sp. LC231]
MLIQYEKGNTLLHRYDPLSKLVILFCTAVIAMLLDQAWQQALFLLLCIGQARFAGQVSGKRLLGGIRLIAIVAVPYFILTSLTVKGETIWLQWGPISLTEEALNAAGAMTLRMFTLFLTSMAYILTTDPRELVAELTRRLRIPYRFAFGISAALTFIPLLEEEGTHILAAQQVRGHRPPRGLGNRISYGLKFVSAVLLNALRRVQQTAGAMESKGFGAYPERTYRTEVNIPLWAVISAVMYVLATVFVWWIV